MFVDGETVLESTFNTCKCTNEPLPRILLDQSIGFLMQKFLLVPSATGSFEFSNLGDNFIGTIDSLFLLCFPIFSNRNIYIVPPSSLRPIGSSVPAGQQAQRVHHCRQVLQMFISTKLLWWTRQYFIHNYLISIYESPITWSLFLMQCGRGVCASCSATR